MTGSADVVLDVGSVQTKIACTGPYMISRPTLGGVELPGFLRRLVTDVLAEAGADLGAIWVVVPEPWYDGTTAGAQAQEELRGIVDGLGATQVRWVGQVPAATAALHPGPGSYLICDLGASGLTIGRCEVTNGAVHPCAAVVCAPLGGRVLLHGIAARHGTAVIADLLAMLGEEGGLAGRILERARTDPAYLEYPVFQAVTAGELLEYFGPVADRIRTGIAEVLDGRAVAGAVVTGGFGEFALITQLIRETTGLEPLTCTAVSGALAIAAGDVALADPDGSEVCVAVHEVRNGLLESHWIPVGAPFAEFRGVPLVVRIGLGDKPVHLEMDGRARAVGLPPLIPGAYQIGLRPARSGPGVLVFRPEAGGDCAYLPLEPVQEPG
jgi:hypothetical protein